MGGVASYCRGTGLWLLCDVLSSPGCFEMPQVAGFPPLVLVYNHTFLPNAHGCDRSLLRPG